MQFIRRYSKQDLGSVLWQSYSPYVRGTTRRVLARYCQLPWGHQFFWTVLLEEYFVHSSV